MKASVPAIATTETSLQQQVAEQLRLEIESGSWPTGAKLPSAALLCERFGVSNITVRGALRELAQAGLVESRPRSGVFVRSDWALTSRGSERSIGLLLTAIRHPFFAEIIEAAEEACYQAGYSLTLANSGDDAEIEAAHIRRLMKTSAGLIIAPVTGPAPMQAYQALLELGTPFVQVVRYLPEINAPFVVTDNRLGGYQAAQHLLEVGCRTIFLLKDYEDSAAQERCEGYEQALRENRIEPRYIELERNQSTLIASSAVEHSEAVGYTLMQQALHERSTSKESLGPLGVFALNAQLARGSYLALKKARMQIPRDVAVVGFDDFGAVFFDPPLTTVTQDLAGIGKQAAQLLLQAMSARSRQDAVNHAVQQLRLQPELIIRNSTDTKSPFCIRRSGSLLAYRSTTGQRARTELTTA